MRPPNGGTAKDERKAKEGPGGQIFGLPQVVEDVLVHDIRMVRCQAPRSVRRGDRIRELDSDRVVPILRIEGNQERRAIQESRPRHEGMQRMRPEIQPADGLRLRFEEDTPFGMDRIPRPPFPVPFRQDVVFRQQKRRFHRPLLAFQSLRRPRWVPGWHRAFRQGLDRRDLFPEMAVRNGAERGEGASAGFPKTNSASAARPTEGDASSRPAASGSRAKARPPKPMADRSPRDRR